MPYLRSSVKEYSILTGIYWGMGMENSGWQLGHWNLSSANHITVWYCSFVRCCYSFRMQCCVSEMFSTVPNSLQKSTESCVLRLKIKKQSLLLKPCTKQRVINIAYSNILNCNFSLDHFLSGHHGQSRRKMIPHILHCTLTSIRFILNYQFIRLLI